MFGRRRQVSQFGLVGPMNAEFVYERLAVGETGSLTYQGRTDDANRWERFAQKIRRLDEMEAEGLIRIDATSGASEWA